MGDGPALRERIIPPWRIPYPVTGKRMVAVMTSEERKRLAREKGISPGTLARWIREHGEDAAKVRTKIDASQAGRLGRQASGDSWLWGAAPARPRVQSRGTPFDW